MKDRPSRRGPRRVTASHLRADVYRILDGVLASWQPVEVQRRGAVLRISPAEPAGRLARLVPRPGFIKGDPDDLVHLDWSDEWRP